MHAVSCWLLSKESTLQHMAHVVVDISGPAGEPERWQTPVSSMIGIPSYHTGRTLVDGCDEGNRTADCQRIAEGGG